MKLRRPLTGYRHAYITIEGLSIQAISELVKSNTAKNPVWLQSKQHSPTGYVSPLIPEWLYYAWNPPDAMDTLHLYRGFCTDFCSPGTLKELDRVYYKDQRVTAPVKFDPFKLTPNKEQVKMLKSAHWALKNSRPSGNVLLVASTSVGKTILQAMLAAQLGQKTLILCPTALIMEAWYGDLQKLFGYKLKQIGLIKQAKWEIGEQFTLGSIQTLHRRRQSWDDLNQTFGTLIVDEVQGMSAQTLFDFVTQMPVKYLIGATATAQRNGRPISQVDRIFGEPVAVIDTTSKETEHSMPITAVRTVDTMFEYDYQFGNLQWHDLAAHLAADEERNQLIVKKVMSDWADGKVVIVVTKTHEHVEMLVELFKEAGVHDVNRLTGRTNPNKKYTRTLLKMVNKRDCRLLISTLSAISKGANIRALDNLHIVMPPANKDLLEQLLGRLRRKFDEDKISAEVTWYLDDRVGYLRHLYVDVAVPIFKKMKIAGYIDTHVVA